MEYLAKELGKGDTKVNIPIITDHFTRYTQGIVTNSQTVKVTAQIL